MDHEAIITVVQQAAGADCEHAERMVRATLQTIAERISVGAARKLAAQLPTELAPWLGSDVRSEPFDVDEFLRRVAAHEEADLPTRSATGASSWRRSRSPSASARCSTSRRSWVRSG